MEAIPIPDPQHPLILNCSAEEMLTQLNAQGVRGAFGISDNPWLYTGGKNNTQRGLAGFHYEGMSEADLTLDHLLLNAVLAENSYVAVWVTFPKLGEWMSASTDLLTAAGLRYVTGGVWAKVGGFGAGYHLRGDAELLLIYCKGAPKVRRKDQSDLWMFEEGPTGLWTAQRGEHSHKPWIALEDLITLCTDPGDLILNLYSGNAATMEICCRRLGRRVIGCELDPERWRMGQLALSQVEAFAVPSAPPPPTQTRMEVD